MITTFYPPYNFGGDGIFVHRLANELARQGHQIDVIHCRDAYRLTARHDPEDDYDDHPNVTVHGLKSPFGILSPLASQQTGFPLFKSAGIRRVLNQGFNVIHYHNISLFGPKVLEFGRGIKLYTMHEYWLVCPTHVLFKDNREACEQPHCFRCTLIYKRPPQLWRQASLLEAAAKHVDRFIAPSQFCEAKHRQRGFAASLTRLPHFVSSAENDSAPSAQADKSGTHKPYFLFVGRLEKLKGLQTLIPIFRNFDKAQLWIAGSGSYDGELRRLAGNNHDVRFLGQMSAQQLRQLYRQAIAVIVPSLCFETFGQVIVEAFRERTPALARNLGALPEIIDESGGGLLYNTDAELIEAMNALLSDESRRKNLGMLGHIAYLRNWTPEVHMPRYMALIDELTTKKSEHDSKVSGAD